MSTGIEDVETLKAGTCQLYDDIALQWSDPFHLESLTMFERTFTPESSGAYTFKVDDADAAFLPPLAVILYDSSGNQIKSGGSSISYNVEKGEIYEIEVRATSNYVNEYSGYNLYAEGTVREGEKFVDTSVTFKDWKPLYKYLTDPTDSSAIEFKNKVFHDYSQGKKWLLSIGGELSVGIGSAGTGLIVDLADLVLATEEGEQNRTVTTWSTASVEGGLEVPIPLDMALSKYSFENGKEDKLPAFGANVGSIEIAGMRFTVAHFDTEAGFSFFTENADTSIELGGYLGQAQETTGLIECPYHSIVDTLKAASEIVLTSSPDFVGFIKTLADFNSIAEGIRDSIYTETDSITPGNGNIYQDIVQKAYIAYYGRAGDAPGIEYWASRLEEGGGKLESIIDAFGTSAEFNEVFGHLDNESLIDNVYQQLLHRAPDASGKAFYLNLLNTGQTNLQRFTIDVLYGASGDDIATIQNKLEVANNITNSISPEKALEMPPSAWNSLKNILTSIDCNNQCTDETLANIQNAVDGLFVDDFDSSIHTTGELPLYEVTYGELETGGDTDWFEVDLQEGTTYEVSTSTWYTETKLQNPIIEGVYDNVGKQVVEAPENSQDIFDFTVNNSGKYYVAVAAKYDHEYGNYKVHIHPHIVDDYGETPSTAGVLPLGESVNGSIESTGDVDFFRIAAVLEKGETYQINMGGLIYDPLLLGIYDSDGKYIENTRDDDSGDGRNAQVVFSPENTGEYYVAATSGNDYIGDYQLSVSRIIDSIPSNLIGSYDLINIFTKLSDGQSGWIGVENTMNSGALTLDGSNATVDFFVPSLNLIEHSTTPYELQGDIVYFPQDAISSFRYSVYDDNFVTDFYRISEAGVGIEELQANWDYQGA